MKNFSIQNTFNQARAATLKTAHGNIKTPFFMPIATRGAVKYLSAHDMLDLNSQIILSNTYHLYLKPGLDVLKKSKGLHNFMNWQKPILTDSGGYQVFSLSDIRKIQNDGVKFTSTYDGSKHFFTPKKVMEIQKIIGSDIMMVLDECPPYPCTYGYANKSQELTTSWARAAIKARKNKQQLLFGIVQGSVFKDLRIKSAQDLVKLNFDGYAIGGLAVGETADKMYDVLDVVNPLLPVFKPRYLMGVGQPEQILEAVKRGVDMFDCVLPTRNARHGSLYYDLKLDKNLKNVKYKILRIKSEKLKKDLKVIDSKCNCSTCNKGYTRSYLRHLATVNEPLCQRLCTIHNVNFYLELMRQIRNIIIKH